MANEEGDSGEGRVHMEMLEEQRENWGSRSGFVLAAIGSAVGLGNLWGFPYKLYSYGGGAFLIPYIAAMFCVGIPMLVLEFSLGHLTQRAAPDAFRRTHKRHEFIGWWGILLGFVIVTYYPVILAYCFSFIYYSGQSIVHGTALPWAGEGVEGVKNAKEFFFTTYLTGGEAVGPFQKNIVFTLVLAWAAMYLCIFKGVNTVGKVVWLTVPLPWLLLAVLTVRGLTLPGSVKGLVYYLDPVWSRLAEPTTWRYAFGQVFFSLSLAFGVMLTYASFLHRKSDLNNNATIIGLADFATSFVAGLAIFSTLGAMAFATSQTGHEVSVENVVDGGPGLAFVAFPYALAQLPGAAWWSLLFFSTLVMLGIDSAFSITESVLAGLVDKTGWPRCAVLPAMSVVGLVCGLIFVTGNGLNWLGTIDGFINGTWGIAFLGLLECIVLGWLYNVDRLRRHANERSDWQLGRWWNWSIRIFIPVVLGTLFLWSLFDDATMEGGFLRNPETGEWNVYNCVGMCVVMVVPAASILLSMVRSRLDDEKAGANQVQDISHCRGRVGGGISFGMAIAGIAGLGYGLVSEGVSEAFQKYLVFEALGLGVVAMLAGNYILERCSNRPEYPSGAARWSGILGALSTSGALAVLLIHATVKAVASEEEGHAVAAREHLSGVAYVILGVVLLVIFVGLGWCFYRAMAAAGAGQAEVQEAEGQ